MDKLGLGEGMQGMTKGLGGLGDMATKGVSGVTSGVTKGLGAIGVALLAAVRAPPTRLFCCAGESVPSPWRTRGGGAATPSQRTAH